MSEMERVARAVWQKSICDYCSTDDAIPLTSDCCAVKAARAAIEALRTPNAAILEILQESPVMDGYEPHPGQALEIWNRIIDAALKESP